MGHQGSIGLARTGHFQFSLLNFPSRIRGKLFLMFCGLVVKKKKRVCIRPIFRSRIKPWSILSSGWFRLFLRHMLACPAFFPSSEMVSEIGRSVSDHLADRRLTPPKPSSARPHLPEPSIGFFPSSEFSILVIHGILWFFGSSCSQALTGTCFFNLWGLRLFSDA